MKILFQHPVFDINDMIMIIELVRNYAPFLAPETKSYCYSNTK